MARITYGDGKVLEPTPYKALIEHMKNCAAKRDAESVKRAEHEIVGNRPKVKVTIYAPTIDEFLARRKR